MSKVSITGNASGTGTFTIAAPNSNTDRTLTLPDEAGSFVTADGSGNVDVAGTVTADGLAVDISNGKMELLSSGRLQLKQNTDFFSAGGQLELLSTAGTVGIVEGYQNTAGSSAGAMLFYTNDGSTTVERMRLDSSGNVLVGTNANNGVTSQASFVITAGDRSVFINGKDGNAPLYVNQTFDDSNVRGAIYFYRNETKVGEITVSTTSTSYVTSSDYRLKENWQPMSGSIDRLKNLNPVNFAWKVDGSRVDGFLAHEAAEVVPEAVTGEKDAVEAIGNVTDAEGTVVQENVKEPAELSEGQTWTKTEDRPVYQGIDQAKLVPLLTAALQEAISKIETLEAKVAALEATP